MIRRLAPLAAPIALGLLVLVSLGLHGPRGAYAWFPALGVFPGMALASWLARERPTSERWALGLVSAPLLTALAGWGLLACGLPAARAAVAIAATSFALWVVAELARVRQGGADGAPTGVRIPGSVRWLALAMALLVLLPPLLNRWTLVRSDTWVHAGVALEIQLHGVPPQDPRLAGTGFHFPWLYNLFAALVAAGHGDEPFVAFAVLNVTLMLAWVMLAWRTGLALWGDARAATATALLMALGFNAGAWLLWPLRLLKAMRGDVTGWAEVQRQIDTTPLLSTDVLDSLAAPFSRMVSFLDKFLIGSPLSTAWLMMLVLLWALATWLRHGSRRMLVWAAIASAGMLFFHGVVGLSMLPVLGGTLALAALLSPVVRVLPARGSLLAFLGAMIAGALIALPYTFAVASGWAPERMGVRHTFLAPSALMVWTLFTSCAVAGALSARRLVSSWRTGPGIAALLGLYAAAFAIFACVVHLPQSNEHKFAFLVFVPLALLGGEPLRAAWDALRSSGARHAARTAAVLLFVVPAGLTFAGYLLDPRARTDPYVRPAPDEAALYAWIREQSPGDAVFVDHRSRDQIMVNGRRRLLAGTPFGPELAAFPKLELDARRDLMAGLYERGTGFAGDTRVAKRLGEPLYVVYRRSDFAPGTAPWTALDTDPRCTLERADDHYRVYRFSSAP